VYNYCCLIRSLLQTQPLLALCVLVPIYRGSLRTFYVHTCIRTVTDSAELLLTKFVTMFTVHLYARFQTFGPCDSFGTANKRDKIYASTVFNRTNQSQSHISTDGQPVSLGLMTRYLLLFDSYGLVFLWDALSDERTGLSPLHAAGPCQRSFLRSYSFGTCDHILLSHIRDFPFRRLLRLAGSRWRYSTPPPHGGNSD
jgi:hypothetical protein